MGWLRRALRTVRVGLVCGLALLVGIFVAAQISNRVFRWRAERLLADMQAVELHKSTWADAQRIMTRWGKWGHYDGQCDASNCRYEIQISDAFSVLLARIPAKTEDYFKVVRIVRTYDRLGGREANLRSSFIVQDGQIVRRGAYFVLSVPWVADEDSYPWNYGYALIANVVSVQRVLNWGDFRSGARLASDLYYGAGKPGGCEGCMEATIVYSDRTPPEVVVRLNAIRLDCLTSWKRCTTIEDVLPASKPFHLYDGAISGRPALSASEQLPEASPHPCNIPIWARGRDATWILSVDVLHDETVKDGGAREDEKATVRVTGSIKSDGNHAVGESLAIHPYSFDANYPSILAEHLEPGKRYLVAFYDRGYFKEMGKSKDIGLDPCGILDDTPEVRIELERGIASNDHLRQPELRHWPIP
jgi:hypothetical protein